MNISDTYSDGDFVPPMWSAGDGHRTSNHYMELSPRFDCECDHTNTFRHLVGVLGEEMTNSVLGKLDQAAASSPLLKATYNAICTTGINFADGVTQSQIDKLAEANVFTAEEAAALKGIGVQSRSLLEAAGLSDVTEEQIHEERQNNYQLAVLNKIRFVYNSTIERADQGQITWQEFVDLVNSL